MESSGLNSLKMAEWIQGSKAPVLLAGTYELHIQRGTGNFLAGTLRVEKGLPSGAVRVSGDLYRVQNETFPTDPKATFPQRDYRFYLRVDSFNHENSQSVVQLTAFPYLRPSGRDHYRWNKSGEIIRLIWSSNTTRRHSGQGQWGGDTVRFECRYFGPGTRQAFLEVAHEPDVQLPETPSHKNLTTTTEAMGWNMKIVSPDIRQGSLSQGSPWTKPQLHKLLTQHRRLQSVRDWAYHLFFLKGRLPGTGKGPMGLLYTELSSTPARVGGALSLSHQLDWADTPSSLKGKRLDEVPRLLLWMCLHELGRMQNLGENGVYKGPMAQPGDVLGHSKADLSHLSLEHSAPDLRLLNHAPDPVVRPGGIYGVNGNYLWPLYPLPIPWAQPLTVAAVQEGLPLGAPLRFNLALPTPDSFGVVPRRLSMTSMDLRGEVTNLEADRGRTFSPSLRWLYPDTTRSAKSGDRSVGSVTLFAGEKGALAPEPGNYAISFTAHWHDGQQNRIAQGSTEFTVNEPPQEAVELSQELVQSASALSEALIWEDFSDETRSLMERALDSDWFASHFTGIEAKHLTVLSTEDVDLLGRYIRNDTILSGAEIRHLTRRIETGWPPEEWVRNPLEEVIRELHGRPRTFTDPVTSNLLDKMNGGGI